MLARHQIHNHKYQVMTGVTILSAWSFVVVIASLLFLWVGYRLDEWLGTAPIFMLSLFFISFVACLTRLYQEAKTMMKDI